MANYLDTSPDAPCIAAWKQSGQLVPLARGGELICLADPTYLVKHMWSSRRLSVEDYVVGLELLGFRFHLQKGQDGTPNLFREEPDLPPSWGAHELRIADAFGPGRMDEVRAFIIKRDGGL